VGQCSTLAQWPSQPGLLVSALLINLSRKSLV
jgi:hypothetical protein